MNLLDITAEVAGAQREDRLTHAAAERLARGAAEAGRADARLPEVAIRLAGPADGHALELLRLLDGRERGWAGGGDVLVALVDGELVAALGLGRPGGTVADPFRRTAGVLRLLHERARQAREAVREPRGAAAPVLVRAR